MFKTIAVAVAKQTAMNMAGIVIAVALLGAAGYVSAIVHERNCKDINCLGIGTHP